MTGYLETSDGVGIGNNDGAFLKRIVRGSWVILVLLSLYQLVFFTDETNLIAVAAVILVWFVTTNVWLKKEILERYLISTFIILGFTTSQFYFPLLFTTLENKPLIYNLEMPEEVFLHSTLCLLVLLAAHANYRFLMRFRFNRSTSLMAKAGFFDGPTHLQVWLMGALGMASTVYVYFTAPDIGREVTGAASDKLIQGLVPFSYAPFFIPMAKLYGNKQKLHKGYIPMIAAYSILLFAMSMARNSRGAFIFGLTTPAFAYALGLMLGVFKTKIFTIRNIVVVGIGAWVLLGPFTDLGTAMLIVRGGRADITPGELITQTLETLDDKKAIEARKKDDQDESMDFDWDERYLDNIFTARFANIKFNDSNLITQSKVGTFDPDMQEFSLDQLIVSLPDPVIKMFKFDVDKEEVLSVSFGDFLYILSGGFGTPAGFRIGHIAGTGMAAFGWWYLLLFGLVMTPVFYLSDKLFRRKRSADIHPDTPTEDRFRFSFCAILALTMFFQFLLIESVVQGATFITRAYVQMIVLYFLIFHISRIVSKIFSRKKSRVRLVPQY